ncbi:MAG: M48 family metallopeptidase [Candidatus Paceibacterota bacterium]|jgi:hypothetical protein|nr:M48 family metallopeptidase [Candidatus Paceibacterota bacterium]
MAKIKPPTPREKRKAYIQARLAYWNQFYGFSWNRVTIKNMRSRLGSCSSLRNLNFASKLFSYPPEVIDYVVVHELCHLKEMNHSKRFYDLIAQTIPDWKERKASLKKRDLRKSFSLFFSRFRL